VRARERVPDYGYLINGGEGNYTLYYYNNGSIMSRNSLACRAEKVSEATSAHFSVSVQGGIPMLAYINGADVILQRGDERKILKGANSANIDFLRAVCDNAGIRFIYMSGKQLVTRSVGKVNGESIILDEPVGTIPFTLIPVVEDGYALIYGRRTIGANYGAQLGYRELTVYGVSEYKEIFSTGFDIGDNSVCVSNNSLHFVFVAMSRFSVRVMYTAKEVRTNKLRQKMLWEGNRCKGVCIAASGNNIFVWWESCGCILSTTSHDFGESFDKPSKIGRGEAGLKVLDLSGFGVSELLLTENYDICAPDEVKAFINGYRHEITASVKADMTEIGQIGEIENLKKELIKKQNEIDKLSYALRIKNEETSRVENSLRLQCRQLKTKIKEIQQVSENY
jgi:hypothetical protein